MVANTAARCRLIMAVAFPSRWLTSPIGVRASPTVSANAVTGTKWGLGRRVVSGEISP